ncbi:MAG TPA: hypothetical protein VFN68_08705 [Acidimicrobiales bacterium]|nr:hypothetical protein [Acidimicrobiales bacterium]
MNRPTRPAQRNARCVLAACVLLATTIIVTASGCAAVRASTPACRSLARLGLVAQSVPSAAYVPCVNDLPPGWSVPSFDVRRGSTQFALLSDRSQGHAVKVRLTGGCQTGRAEPTTSRGPGVQTFIRLSSIDPRYAGTLYDVFPGGCITYRFDLRRGPHIALMQEFEDSVMLMPRHQLQSELHTELGLQLQP